MKMYQSKYDKEYKDESNFVKRNILWLVLLFVILGVGGWFFTTSTKVVDTAFIRYEEFQEIYNTCQKVNSDLAIIKNIPDNDPMFASFSKQAMLSNKKQQLTRWIEEYNAKSKMWNRAMWKSSSLPYQLDVSQFSNFK